MQSFKVWNAERTDRRCVSATSLNELKSKSAEKLGYTDSIQDLRLVCELDGQPVDDHSQLDHVYQTRQVLLLLRPNEKWTPSIDSSIPTSIGSIPQVVLDALRKMQLMDKPPPSWKLIDNRGSVTVLLHWDQKDRLALNGLPAVNSSALNGCTCTPLPLSNGTAHTDTAYLELLQVGKRPCHAHNYGWQLQVAASRGRLSPRPPSFNEDELRTGTRAPEEEDLCEQLINGTPIIQLMSPLVETARCDFHCAGLHSIATPANAQHILAMAGEQTPDNLLRPTSPGSGLIKKPRETQKGHVRFVDENRQTNSLLPNGLPTDTLNRVNGVQQPVVQIAVTSADQCENASTAEVARKRPPTSVSDATVLDRVEEESRDDYESSTSEAAELGPTASKSNRTITASKSEDGAEEGGDEAELSTEKHLLLVDQVEKEQLPTSSHLTIKEIGQILDKLSSKIVDVDKLEREKDGLTHNWLIRATVRGDLAGEIGVVHNGKYYGIVQHPAYC